MLKHLKLRNLLWLGYSVPVGLIGIIFIMVLSSYYKIAENMKKLDQAEQAIIYADQMNNSILKMVRDFRGYLIFDQENLVDSLNKNWEDLQEYYQKADVVVNDPEQQKKLDTILGYAREWHDDFAIEVIKLARSGRKAEGIAIVRDGKGIKLVDSADKLNQKFNEIARQNLQKVQAEANSALFNLVIIVLIIGIVSIIIAIIGSYWITNTIANKISTETSVISNSSLQIAASIEEQERTATQQASAVNETTITIDEFTVSSQQSAQQADFAASSSHQVLNLSENGNKSVEKTLNEMELLKQKVASIAQKIQHLSKQANQIADISNLVSDLANQTNMLALNAAVEAVRAGEQGKGFGIVATEIRRLADGSKESASHINALVADIQTAINSTVSVTLEGTKTVEETLRIANSTSEIFENVTSSINQVVMSNQQIALTAKQQAIATKQILEAMNSINVAARETSDGLAQVKQGLESMNQVTRNLNEIV